jgi:hypothetical protein
MSDEVKTCEDCTKFLLCKKVKDIENLPPLCAKFEDNFPVIEEDVEEDVDEDVEEKEPVMYKCTGASHKCGACPHATPHDPFDEEEYLDGDCVGEYELCEDAGNVVKCVPV